MLAKNIIAKLEELKFYARNFLLAHITTECKIVYFMFAARLDIDITDINQSFAFPVSSSQQEDKTG